MPIAALMMSFAPESRKIVLCQAIILEHRRGNDGRGLAEFVDSAGSAILSSWRTTLSIRKSHCCSLKL